jgi:hypothetical protein
MTRQVHLEDLVDVAPIDVGQRALLLEPQGGRVLLGVGWLRAPARTTRGERVVERDELAHRGREAPVAQLVALGLERARRIAPGEQNLFVVDGGAFVSQADKNPTWTILALSMRASEYIIDELKKQNI